MHIRNIITSRLLRGVAVASTIALIAMSSPLAQSIETSASAPLFLPGTLLVSRSTYIGSASTVPFPGSLPNNAASLADGSFPNVFNNETPDASFGVTSPILVDQLTRAGGLIGTISVTSLIATQLGLDVSTSFPSKSELGLNVTPDGTGIAFMAYGAAPNLLDVSNSNTPGHVDMSNPVNGRGVLIFQRDIVELSTNGAVQVTATNGYSGNNGRNVVLGGNGNYYTVGNAGNNGSSVTLAAGTVAFAGTSVTLSGTSTTANLYVGAPLAGTGIPTATYITNIADSTHFTISAAGTGSPSGAYTANAGAFQLAGVSFTAGNVVITVADTSKLVPGMPLSGSGFAAGSYIQSVSDATHFVASAAPTGNVSPGASYVAAVSNSMLSDNTGVRTIQKGLSDTTGTGTGILDAVNFSTVVGKVNGTYGTTPGYQRGFSVTQIGAAADKSGKDDNFRGIATYNNTLYVTKGSGGNGFDAVYQVNPTGGAYVTPGASAGLAATATAGLASINPLPGWPTNSTGACESKNTGACLNSIVHHPFGIWFANDTTLYVADEGSASVTNAAAGGLEKWTYDVGTSKWELQYTLAASTIPGYNVPGVGNLQALGLRNITGVDNGDGTVTIYGITSTTGQTLNDEGADPNQLVTIVDKVPATSLPVESFAVLETAAYGDVLRGVAVVPGLAVTRGGVVRDRRTQRFVQQDTVQNLTSTAVTGAVYLVLDNLGSNATLANATGLTSAGSPYVLVPGTESSGLAIGASAGVVLQFINPTNGAIVYSARAVSGSVGP